MFVNVFHRPLFWSLKNYSKYKGDLLWIDSDWPSLIDPQERSRCHHQSHARMHPHPTLGLFPGNLEQPPARPSMVVLWHPTQAKC